MSDRDRRAETTGAEVETLQRPGLVLARSREDAGLSQQQLAVALNVGVNIIQALDEDDYEALGAPVFARGHLRRYAEYLKMDPTPLLEAYATIADLTEPKVVVPERAGETVHSPVGRQVGLVIVLLVTIVSAGIWFKTVYQSYGGEEPTTAPVATPASTERTTPSVASVAEVTDDATDEPGEALVGTEVSDGGAATDPAVDADPEVDAEGIVADIEEAASTAASDVVADSPVTPQAGTAGAAGDATPADSAEIVRLNVEFMADAWLEVTDANGEVLFYNLGGGGSSIDLDGRAPLAVFVGDATAVAMRSEGFIIDVTRFQRSDRTARFAVDVNGMVRRR